MRIIEFGGDLNELNNKKQTPLAFANSDFLKKIHF